MAEKIVQTAGREEPGDRFFFAVLTAEKTGAELSGFLLEKRVGTSITKK